MPDFQTFVATSNWLQLEGRTLKIHLATDPDYRGYKDARRVMIIGVDVENGRMYVLADVSIPVPEPLKETMVEP